MFDSEGSVALQYGKKGQVISGNIQIANSDEKLIDLCCYFLDKLNIDYYISIAKRKTKDIIIIYIKPNSYNDFKNLIGTSINRKLSRMEILCNIKRRKQLTNEEKLKIKELYKTGHNINKISKIINRSRTAIRNAIKDI